MRRQAILLLTLASVALAQGPVCNAGAQQSFRVGTAGTLDGSASTGTSLSYAWTLLSGPSVTWTSQNTVTPGVTVSAFGTDVFQLVVTDSSAATATCAVKDGAVVTDAHDIVVTGDSAVDTLLGPMVRWGANPWPWFDNRHKQAADNQITVMDTYFPAWWDTPGPGTVTVTNGSATVVGSGTTFTTTFCQGPGSPTVPIAGYPMIAVWHPLGSGTGRRMFGIASCTDDTHLTLDSAWSSEFTPGSGLTYAADSQYAATWGWSMVSSPGNYYDNVAAYYALYYRSGIDDYLTAARKLADRFWESPMIDQGTMGGWYSFAARSTSAMGLVLRALDGRPEMWVGLHTLWDHYLYYLTAYDVYHGMWDQREMGYHLAMISYCALFDTDTTPVTGYRSICKAAIINSFPAVWTPDKFPDGSWPVMYSQGDSWTTTPTTSATLTHGSTAVSGVGTSWGSSSFPAHLWFTDTPSIMPPNDAAGDPVSYTPTWVSGTSLTLDRPYEGTSGSHGWEISYITGWAGQPYMIGILSAAFELAAKAVVDVDPTTAALAHSYNVAAANWIKDYTYWPDTKGLYYTVGGLECQPPIDGDTLCTQGYDTGQSRTLAAETVRGLGAAYAYSHDPSLKAFADTLYNAMWAKPATCPTGSTLCVPDGDYLNGMDDGQYMIYGGPPTNLTPWKWFGLFFGFGAGSSWPGLRIEGYVGTSACTLTATTTLSASATHWSGTDCTGGSFIPGNGDTANIPDGLKLTVDQNWTIGASGADRAAIAIQLNNSGLLEVSSGSTLRSRGSILVTQSGTYTDTALTLDAGSALIFDASQAADPSAANYIFGSDGPEQWRGFAANGTAGSHVTITSDVTNGGGQGYFYAAIGGHNFVATYTDFSNIGLSYCAFCWGWWGSSPTITGAYIMQHNTFDHVGPMRSQSGGIPGGEIFLLDHNLYTDSFGYDYIAADPLVSGSRIMSNNVFDRRFNDGDGACGSAGILTNLTISGNYFGNRMCAVQGAAAMADNFIRNSLELPVISPFAGGYAFMDITADDNPHWTAYSQTASMSGFIFDQPDDVTGDSGEVFLPWLGSSGAYTETLNNSILVPSKTGHSVSELTGYTTGIPIDTSLTTNLYHNTWTGAAAIDLFGMVDTNEAGAGIVPLTNLKSNLAWSNGGAYYKVAVEQTGSLLQDSVTAADYNSADSNVILTDPACTGCTNQGRGYIGKWTATPGAHDATASPYFADQYRNVALWDTKYLGHAAATAWNGSSHSYNVGDLVSDSHAGYYGGATINFRCTAAHTSGSTTEPNVGASWRTDWEWASLADIRTATSAGTTYTDGAIGCAGCTAIQALVKWVQRGFTPQNPALWCAGHDGETIGAVPFCGAGKALIGALAGL